MSIRRTIARGIVVAVLALAACKDKKAAAPEESGVEDLTIVVEADKSRILQEEQDLQQKKDTFEKDQERLAKEKANIDAKLATLSKKDRKQREELEAQQRRLADDERRVRERASVFESDRQKLDDAKSKLIDRISKMTATKGGLTIEQREQVIAQREKEIAQREKAVAEREAKAAAREGEAGRRFEEAGKLIAQLQAGGGVTKTVVVSTPAPAAPSGAAAQATRASVQKLQKQVRAHMDAKGILFDDLPPAAKALQQSANKAADDKDFASAFESFTELDQTIEGVVINGEFVKGKMGRINNDVAKKTLDEGTRKQIQTLLADVGEATNDGRWDRANKKINQIVALLGAK